MYQGKFIRPPFSSCLFWGSSLLQLSPQELFHLKLHPSYSNSESQISLLLSGHVQIFPANARKSCQLNKTLLRSSSEAVIHDCKPFLEIYFWCCLCCSKCLMCSLSTSLLSILTVLHRAMLSQAGCCIFQQYQLTISHYLDRRTIPCTFWWTCLLI